MSKKIQERWFRWDKLINNKEYKTVVKEFDDMLVKEEEVVVGDLIRRDDALELMGIVSLSPNAMYNRKNKDDKTGRT
jgi:hypothetical protein